MSNQILIYNELNGKHESDYRHGGVVPAADPFVQEANVATLSHKTLAQGNIFSDTKVLAASATYDNTATLAALTGFSWTVVAGATYVFDVLLPLTATTSGGLAFAFVLTTATLTSIRYSTYAATDQDSDSAVSATGTTTTSGTKMFNSKSESYLHVRVQGSFVVNAGGTFGFSAAQETAAGGANATVVLIGAQATVTRVL